MDRLTMGKSLFIKKERNSMKKVYILSVTVLLIAALFGCEKMVGYQSIKFNGGTSYTAPEGGGEYTFECSDNTDLAIIGFSSYTDVEPPFDKPTEKRIFSTEKSEFESDWVKGYVWKSKNKTKVTIQIDPLGDVDKRVLYLACRYGRTSMEEGTMRCVLRVIQGEFELSYMKELPESDDIIRGLYGD